MTFFGKKMQNYIDVTDYTNVTDILMLLSYRSAQRF